MTSEEIDRILLGMMRGMAESSRASAKETIAKLDLSDEEKRGLETEVDGTRRKK